MSQDNRLLRPSPCRAISRTDIAPRGLAEGLTEMKAKTISSQAHAKLPRLATTPSRARTRRAALRRTPTRSAAATPFAIGSATAGRRWGSSVGDAAVAGVPQDCWFDAASFGAQVFKVRAPGVSPHGCAGPHAFWRGTGFTASNLARLSSHSCPASLGAL
jgi:hypothetical protein